MWDDDPRFRIIDWLAGAWVVTFLAFLLYFMEKSK